MRVFKVVSIKVLCCMGLSLAAMGLTACGGGGSGDTTSSSGGGSTVTTSSINLPTSVEVVSAK